MVKILFLERATEIARPLRPPASAMSINKPGSFSSFRLVPGDDLKAGILFFCRENGLQNASIVTCVGSLKGMRLRLAGATKGKDAQTTTPILETSTEQYEICSLVGTIDSNGSGGHLHVMLGDEQGGTVAGHVLEGCIVFTTAEITLLSLQETAFSRTHDSTTGYPELTITNTTTSSSSSSSSYCSSCGVSRMVAILAVASIVAVRVWA
jgi:uncharacterized protein